MKNSEQFKLKLLISKIAYIFVAVLIIFLLTKYTIAELLPLFNSSVIIPIYICITIFILMILIYCLIIKNNFSKEEKNKIYDELDNKIEKTFDKYGLYITKNYIICTGSKINIFKLFAVPIKEIDAIDTFKDSRYYYRKDGKKRKFASFITASIKDDLVFGDNNRYVFNIICGKKIYCVTTSHSLNKNKTHQIKEMADYICDKYKDIDYV